MHRFFLLDTLLQPGQPVNLSAIAHQLRNVLRLEPGVQILLLNGSGTAFRTEIVALERHAAQGNVLAEQVMASEPAVYLTLYQGSLKADKFEWVLQKGTELGVARFVPVICARSIVRPAAALLKKYERWQQIVQEAAEQSGRTRLPQLHAPLEWRHAVHHAHGPRFMPWEESASAPGALGLGQAVAGAMLQHGASTEINLLIGPEGGISPQEAQEALGHGWHAVSLGPRILRAETAALAATTIVMERLLQLS